MIHLLLKKIKQQNQLLPYHIILIIIFTIIFNLYSPYSDNEEDKKNFSSFFQTFYFTTVTHFTVGFGDITPKSNVLRSVTMCHMFLTFLLLNI